MSLYLAIDAGGTKTACLLADERRVLARASTGTVKLMRVSEEEATERLQRMLEEVAHAAGVSLERVTRTCFGLAGVSSPAVRTWARQILPAMVAGEFLLLGDEEIALDAAFHGGPGILVIAGTGSNVVGRDPAGTLFTAGGWGPVLGDEGSGFWIGLEAIRAGLRAQDRVALGEPSSRLLAEIQAFWQLEGLPELVAFGNQRSGVRRPAPDFSTLAPVVAECAHAGDALARLILNDAGRHLASQVDLVARKMSAVGRLPGVLGVAYTGSVLSHIEAVRDAMQAALAASGVPTQMQPQPVDSLEGALWRARNP